LYLLQTVPGIGKMLRLVLLYAIHRSARFPSVQACASSCRLGKGSKASGGKRLGPAGHTIGQAQLTWACGEAAALFRRHNEAGQQYLARLENQHDKGKTLSSLAHQLARAVYSRLKRKVALDRDILLRP
jgi:transposase